MTVKIPKALYWAWGWALLLLAGLQIWRPYFFLTDDNVCYYWPLQVAWMRRLWHGESVFFEPNIFGGVNLLRDPVALPLWSPVNFLVSPLALGPFRFALVDVLASFNLILAVTTFILMGRCLRERFRLDKTDAELIFLALSYSFSAFAISIGSSWQMFLANVAILPAFVWGQYHPNSKRGAIIIGVAGAYGILAGHLHPTVWTIVFFSVYTLATCLISSNPSALKRSAAGLGLSLLLASPFLIPAALGFLSSARGFSAAVNLVEYRVSPWTLFLSWTFGSFSSLTPLVNRDSLLLNFASPNAMALAGCMAGGLLWPLLINRQKWTRMEVVVLGTAFLTIICVARPNWLAWTFQHLPLLKSLRWPFREILFVQFFLHLLFVLRSSHWPKKLYWSAAATGAVVWFGSMGYATPPTLANMTMDRNLLISGQAEEFGAKLRALSFNGAGWIPVVPREAYRYRDSMPWSLCGAFNYPALIRVPSLSGYTADGFQGTHGLGAPGYYGGTFEPAQVAGFPQNPNFITLEIKSLTPLRMQVGKHGQFFVVPAPELPHSN